MESVDRSSRQKINTETLVLKDTLYEMDLIDIQNIYPKPAEYTFFTSTHGTLSRTDHKLSHKTSLNKFEKI